MATLDQRRAINAYAKVESVPESDRKKYASIVYSLPALTRSAGLCQALHFVATRDASQKLVLEHLATALDRPEGRIANGTALLNVVRNADVTQYIWLTSEALACMTWFRRAVQALWDLDLAEVNRAEH